MRRPIVALLCAVVVMVALALPGRGDAAVYRSRFLCVLTPERPLVCCTYGCVIFDDETGEYLGYGGSGCHEV